MKIITRLSLVLMIFSLLSVSYLVTSVSAQDVANPGMNPGMRGDHHDEPPIDPRSGQPFTRADEVKYQKYADECEATNGLLSEGSAQALIAEGFTRMQLDKLCNESGDSHEGRNHDGPGGMPGTVSPGGAGPMTGGNR